MDHLHQDINLWEYNQNLIFEHAFDEKQKDQFISFLESNDHWNNFQEQSGESLEGEEYEFSNTQSDDLSSWISELSIDEQNELKGYIEYLENKQKSNYVAILTKPDPNYETSLRYYMNRGMEFEEIFFESIRTNNIVLFRKMLVDTRLNPNYNNNQAIIICIVHFRYYILNLLLKDARIQPHDQNNLAIRLSLLKRDKKLVDMLLCHQAVVHQIYTDPQLLNYIIGYQNNGNQFI